MVFNSNIFPGYPCFEKNIQTKADYLQNTVIKPIEIKEGLQRRFCYEFTYMFKFE